jgi:hypothetical protein
VRREVVLSTALVAVVSILASCQDLSGPSPELTLDEPYFRCRVQPLLTKNCSNFACHGDGARPFTVFARNRLRLGGTESERNAFLSEDERAYNYRAASAMVDAEHPDESPLLLKPLAEEAGGWFHGATELEQGLDVFDGRDGEWMVISDWAHGATEAADCLEPGSDL